MGRFYELALYPAGTNLAAQPKPTRLWSSVVGGVFDPGALEIQFDITTFDSANSRGASTITLNGVSLADLQQAQQYAGLQIQLKGGMSGGLPLENSGQIGPLIAGYVLQSFGNWTGTDQNLSLVVFPPTYTYDTPGKFTLNWKAHTPLSGAIRATLKTAFPDLDVVVNINDDLYRRDVDIPAHYSTLGQLGMWITKATRSKDNPGVHLFAPTNNIVRVLDGSSPGGSTTQINFNDLVGQPTWNAVNTVQFATVLRGDITVGTSIIMPKGLPDSFGFATTAPMPNVAMQGLKRKPTFEGKWSVISVRHIGGSRDPSGGSWISVFECISQNGAMLSAK